MKSLITSIILLVFISMSSAQDWHWQRNDELLNPSGIKTKGMNTPFTGDFDDDGDIDLIVGCRGGVVQYYENIGTPDTAIWRMDEDYFESLDLDINLAPQPSLIDLNGDGINELFLTYTENYGYPTGLIHLYENIGTTEAPIWEFGEFDFDYENSYFSCHQFVDYDFDLDLDLILASDPFLNEPIYFFENIGDPQNYNFQQNDNMFESLIPQLLAPHFNFRLDDVCADSFFEVLVIADFFDNDGSYTIIYTNEGTIENPEWLEREWLFEASSLTTITLADLDNDSDQDVIMGNHQLPLFFKTNLGSPDSIAVDDYFNGEFLGPIFILWGENICFVDYDNDQDFDFSYFYYILSSWIDLYTHGVATNIGSSSMPLYDFTQGFSLPIGPIHYWDNIYLSAGDLNGDGFPELATHLPAGCYFVNDNGTGYNAIDTLLLDDPEYYKYPELADFDNDGLTDLLIRHCDSLWWRIYKNVGTPEEPQWLWMPDWLSGADRSMGIFRAAKINRDDKIDLVGIGHHMYLHGFINTGTGDDVEFEYDPWIFASWETNRISYYDCVDLDGDGDDDIVVDSSGVINFIENMTPVHVVETETNLPNDFTLLQNYPNPFNGSTNISFTLEKTCKVNLTIFDILGREVISLADETFTAGKHTITWNVDGVLSSGIYFCRLKANDEISSKQMVFIK